MTTTQANPPERIAHELLTQRPMFPGVDGDGCPHYWDSYESAVVVVEDGAGEKFELA